MSLKWIPLDALEPHPENTNRMPERLLEKLKRHIQRTGRYEPLVVRPLPCGKGRTPRTCHFDRGPEGPERRNLVVTDQTQETTQRDVSAPSPGGDSARHDIVPHQPPATPRYQILNGHHRARVLRQLGHTRARCDVWKVDDEEARVLLATLNRLEGRDDPTARAVLVARLAEGRAVADLARLLPEPADGIERLLRLAQPPPEPTRPDRLEPLPRPMTFFLSEAQHAMVSEALRQIGRANPDTESGEDAVPARLARSERLERLALWYLESQNLR